MKWFIPVFAALMVNSAPAAMADCSNGEQIDLRVSKASVFNHLPIRNQGTYGICYAHAANTIIDFHRISRNGGKAVALADPLASAIISTKVMQEMSIDGGKVCDVVDGLKKSGFGCSSSGVTSNQVRDLGNTMQRILVEQVFMPYIVKQKKFERIDGTWLNPAVRKTIEKRLTQNQKSYLDHLGQALLSFENLISNRGIPRDRFPVQAKLAEFFQNVYLNNTWASFEGDLAYMAIRNNCQATKFVMPNLSCKEYGKNSSDLIMLLDESLKKAKPASITICANFLTNKRYSGATSGESTRSDCASHAVVIIGKRERAGSCEYLIRNSWGQYGSYDWPTSGGDVWVNQYSLLNNMIQVQTVN